MKTAIITGCSGQDGTYLTHHLLEEGYKVIGIVRRSSGINYSRLEPLLKNPNLILTTGDITDLPSIADVVAAYQPDEFYHLAAQSYVGASWRNPVTTVEITGLGVLNCLEAVKNCAPYCKFYFASSSEQYGNSIKQGGMLNEASEMAPESPYAASKVLGYNLARIYRRSYNMFTACGILMNHESPLRGEQFVTRKITKGLARVKWGLQDYVELGNMESKRDWGHSYDYVRAMRLMLQQDEPDDYVIATGEAHSVREFCLMACEHFDLTFKNVIRTNSDLIRPKDVDVLIGDSSKAREKLGWKPTVSFDKLVELMCNYDYYAQSPHHDMRVLANNYILPKVGQS